MDNEYEFVGDSLYPGQKLRPGRSLQSKNGWYRLNMQRDGNLVLRLVGSGLAIWASNTEGNPGAELVFQQDDRNIVIYTKTHDAVWETNTDGKGVDRFVVQDDCNVVAYDVHRRRRPARWHSNTRVGHRGKFKGHLRVNHNKGHGTGTDGTFVFANMSPLDVVLAGPSGSLEIDRGQSGGVKSFSGELEISVTRVYEFNDRVEIPSDKLTIQGGDDANNEPYSLGADGTFSA